MRFRVYGIPVPKGSMRAFVVKGHPVLTTSAKGLGEWSQKVAATALGAPDVGRYYGAVSVNLTFYLPRPKSAKKGAMAIHRPDVDKLARAVLDALTGILWDDDAQVTVLKASKKLAGIADEVVPGVLIEVGPGE